MYENKANFLLKSGNKVIKFEEVYPNILRRLFCLRIREKIRFISPVNDATAYHKCASLRAIAKQSRNPKELSMIKYVKTLINVS